MMPQLSNHIKADSMSMYIFSGVLYMIVGFGIFGTVLMMTAERRFELGMLIAIGMKRGLLAKMLLIETVYISLLGVALGSLISLPAVLWLQSHPIRFTGQMAEVYQRFGFEAVLPATLSGSIFLWQAIIVLILAVVAGLYPALHVRKINPASIRQ
jgi:ABC-type antimicrobial peptide transport system permease subunit